MRLDKYLKSSSLIKRREVAKEACDTGHVSINNKVSKPSADVMVDDVIEIRFAGRVVKAKVLSINDKDRKNPMFELI